jgi:putative ABC transport system permease protein
LRSKSFLFPITEGYLRLLSQIIDRAGSYPIDVHIIEKEKGFLVQNRTVAVSETNKLSILRTPISQVTYKDKSFNEPTFRHADPDFFDMFSFPLLKGDTETVFSNPYSVILTEKTVAKYFGDEVPIGKILTVNNSYDVTVTGVIHNESLNSSLEFDLLAPFEILLKESIGENNADNWGFNSFGTYVMLEKSASAENLNQKLINYLKKYNEEDTDALVLQPLADIHLFSNLGHDLSNRGDIKYVWIFSALAVALLTVSLQTLRAARANPVDSLKHE